MIKNVFRPANNQFVIEEVNGDFTFVSYNSVICTIVKNPGMGYRKLLRLYKNWNKSKTTTKYLLQFLYEYGDIDFGSSKEIQRSLDIGYVTFDPEVAVMYDSYYDGKQ